VAYIWNIAVITILYFYFDIIKKGKKACGSANKLSGLHWRS